MGKVTVIIQNKNMPTSQLERDCHELFENTIVTDEDETEIYIVPADEEYPDLS